MLGAVVNNIWSIGSPPGDSDRTNQLFLNPFVYYHFAEGWSVSGLVAGDNHELDRQRR